VDTQTRHALKEDKFRQATVGGVNWVTEHRSNVLRWVITGAVVLAVVIGGLLFWNMRSAAAEKALGAALDVYSATLTAPGAPAEQGSYATAADRAKAANQQFVAVANQYGMTPQGTKAKYFAGVTYQELGQNASAETQLKDAAGSWDRNVANLAKLALANLYHQTGRDPQAIDLYNEVAGKPSTTVPATVAQLDLADLYVAQGKQDQAKALWAKIKESDKDGMAGSIATQKLGGKQ
jgi:predicted negative regulator of RcsB-dependent stress response